MTLLGAVAGLIVGSFLCIADCTGTHRFLVLSCEPYCYLIGPAFGAILGAAAWYLIKRLPPEAQQAAHFLGFWLVVAGLALSLIWIILFGGFHPLVGLLTFPLAASLLYLATRRAQSRYRVALVLAGLGNLSLPFLRYGALVLPSLAMCGVAALILGFGLTQDRMRRILMVLGVVVLAVTASVWSVVSSF